MDRKNGKSNGKSSAPVRGKDGRFLKGNPGPQPKPKQPKKVKSSRELLDEIQLIAQDLMTDKDPKTKASGANLALKIRTLKLAESNPEDKAMHPLLQELFRKHLATETAAQLQGLSLNEDDG